MSDIPYIQQAQEIKITGQDSAGATVNYVGADANGNLNVKDYADGAAGSAVPSVAIQIGGSDGTNLRAISTDNTGKVNLNNISGTISLPTLAATSTKQSDGTQKTQKVDGSGNIEPAGDVVTRSIFVKPGDGTNSISVKAASTAALATDTSEVVALSPNSPIPTGTNSIGAVTQATASNFNAQVVGNIASGSADSGNPVKICGVYNSTLPTPSSGQRVDRQTDLNGRELVANAPLDGYKASYAAAVSALVFAAAATDVFTIYGSASKTIRILRIHFTFTTTSGSGAAANISLIKRSATNTGGTSASVTAVPYDSNNAAATATVLSYTVNPTSLGAAIGAIRSIRDAIVASNTINQVLWDFGNRPSQAIVLRGTSQGLVINLNGATVTGSIADIDIEWTEET